MGLQREIDGPRRRKRMKLSTIKGSPAAALRRLWTLSGSPASGPGCKGKLSKLFLVSAISLIVAGLLSACQLVTIDFAYVAEEGTSGSNGIIQVFAVDSQSGALRKAVSGASSGGPSPVAMAVTADFENLYVANQGNNSVAHFTIATNGTLTAKDSVTLADAPVSVAVNHAGSYLFVVSGTTSAT